MTTTTTDTTNPTPTFDCTDVKALLSALVDDEVPAPQRHQAERHMAACADCRAMLDEAEAVDQLMALEMHANAATGLPGGFEDAVLSQTVHAQVHQSAAQRWINWTGWLAAAAALALAASIWMLDRGGLRRGGGIDNPTIAMGEDINPEVASPADDLLDNDTVIALGAPIDRYENVVIRPATLRTAPPRWPGAPEATPAAQRSFDSTPLPQLDGATTATMRSAAMVMTMLTEATDADDLDFITEVAMYDELASRLKDAASVLPPAMRTTVLSAEALLRRLASGQITAADLPSIADTIRELELNEQFDAWSSMGTTGSRI